VCVVLCVVFPFDRCVILCDVCYLCVVSYCSTIPPGENPFAVKINNIIIIIHHKLYIPTLPHFVLNDCQNMPISEICHKTICK
jgi:hypothetical protein